jgi:Tannase and feruloyl esterase/Alpha/beta hydrolase domain
MGEGLIGTYDDYVPTQAGFGRPFIDVDEQQEEPYPYRLVHGGFEGTETLFSFYLPTNEQYDGRVLQFLEGGAGGHENVMANGFMAFGNDSWQFTYAFNDMGAVLIESNQGHPANAGHTGFHNDVYLFGASAETARFAKWLAARIYGREVHHTYVFGASGGGHRSFQCIMRAPDVYDGGVPEVFGVNPGLYWSVFGQAVSVLGEDVLTVRDAMEPGGSGDPFAGLTFGQREVLRDLFQSGFPRGATTQLAHISVFPFTLYNTIDQNPDYFHDFWNEKGYLGHDDPERLAPRCVAETLKVREVRPAEQLTSNIFVAMQLVTAGATLQTPYGVTLDTDDPSRYAMAKLTVKSGKAAGREMVIADIAGDVLIPFGEKCPELFEGVESGDEVFIDNSDWLAFCHLYLHNVEWNVPGLHGVEGRVPHDYERFAVDGNPVHIQTGIAHYDLDEVVPFPGKMIYVGAVLDICIWPTITSSFDHYVRSVLGDTTPDHYRLWWVENSTHARAEMACTLTGDPPAYWRTRLVDYEAVGAAALTAVRKWVEEGVEPLSDSTYTLTPDKDIVLERDPNLRGGVQPVVELTVDGHDRIEVPAGCEVHFAGKGVVPTGAGTIVEAEMDFEGNDSWPFQAKGADGSAAALDVTAAHTFSTPGTYFPVLRIGSHADGAARTGEAIRNLARVRVVVE